VEGLSWIATVVLVVARANADGPRFQPPKSQKWPILLGFSPNAGKPTAGESSNAPPEFFNENNARPAITDGLIDRTGRR